MKKPARKSELSALAAKVLADHRRAPETPFYDLFALGELFEKEAVDQLDAAYQELEIAGLIEKVPHQSVTFGSHTRPSYRDRHLGTDRSTTRPTRKGAA